MAMLMKKISNLDHRRQLAVKNENNPVIMTLGLQLQVFRGMYNAYYSYSETKAKQLEELYQECCEEMMSDAENQL